MHPLLLLECGFISSEKLLEKIWYLRKTFKRVLTITSLQCEELTQK